MTRKFFTSVLGVDLYEIKVDKKKLLNLLELYDFEYFGLTEEDEGVRLYIDHPSSKRLHSLLSEKKLEHTLFSGSGLPYEMKKLICRPGILLGSIAFVLIMFFYGSFVFDIKIVGNEKMSDQFYIDVLSGEGFRIGSYIPDFEFDDISNSIASKYEDISWIFVNMMGNVAYVEVREYQEGKQEDSQQFDISDLVAKSAGQIYRYEISSGIAKVSIGETVYAGQKLVSGFSKEEKPFYQGRATGKVYAKTSKAVSFETNVNMTEKNETSRTLIKKSIFFLGKEINLLKKQSTFDQNCDIMENEYKLTTFGGAELPITVCERYAVFYETSERELSEEEAKLDAERKMSEYIGSLEEGTVVLGISRSDSFKMGEYRINCRLYLIENIAREVRGEIPPKTEHNG